MLRLLRDPDTGGPSRAVRLVALVVALGMLALSATALSPVLQWLLDIL